MCCPTICCIISRILIYVLIVASSIIIIILYLQSPSKPAKPPVLKDEEWAINKLQKLERQTFEIYIPNDVLNCLYGRLSDTSLRTKFDGTGDSYNEEYLTSLIDYWKNKYDWRSRERLLNTVAHFKILIGGLSIHYVHGKPEQDGKSLKILPLLMLHGWPSSFKEFVDLIPFLTAPCRDNDFVFEVIVPSLPGFVFSDAPTKSGLGTAQTATLMKKMMKSLGFPKFYVHGNDWGAIIASDLATIYPESVIGLHSTMCISTGPSAAYKLLIGSLFPFFIGSNVHYTEIYPRYKIAFLFDEFGYTYLQDSRPDTYASVLTDSPAGLAAYIIGKLTSNNLPVINSVKNNTLASCPTFSVDTSTSLLNDLLDNVMLYYATGSIGTSMTVPFATINSQKFDMHRIPVNTPTVCSAYPNQAIYFPERVLRDKYKNLLYISYPPKGSRFPGYHEPKILLEDIQRSIGAIEIALKTMKY